tara:strand:+ start:31884 stop:32204 length:321 start_codon:yes stop_codon:yes gene_type:complete
MKSIFLATLPSLLAMAEAIPGFDWGTISATGLLGWYLWYTTKVVFPKHREEVSDLTKEMQDHFTEQFVEQRDHYEKLLEDLQTRHDSRHQQIVDTLEKISECLENK